MLVRVLTVRCEHIYMQNVGCPCNSPRMLVRVFPVRYEHIYMHVRFEVFTAMPMKNGVFWDVTPCGFLRSVRRLLVSASS
jgi:hypothetical protein